VVGEASLPSRVSIREVAARDGLQNEPVTLDTEAKAELILALVRAGLSRIEATSFVHPKVVPQLADAEALLRSLPQLTGVSLSVLVPNRKGLERALPLQERFDQVTVFLSASEGHNQRNLGCSTGESLREAGAVIERSRAVGLRCEGVISTAFGCPYEGYVPPQRVLELAEALAEAGAQEVSLADTVGMANPVQVQRLFAAVRERLDAKVELTAHFHNTRGQGLANVLAALQVGVASFESSVGEVGGCPVVEGATGNIATDDLVQMLQELGVSTGIDLPTLLEVGQLLERRLGRPLTSHTLRAGPISWERSPLTASSPAG